MSQLKGMCSPYRITDLDKKPVDSWEQFIYPKPSASAKINSP